MKLKALSLTVFSFVFVSFCTYGQIIKPDTTTNWRKKLLFNINVNQAAFSSNWKAGGISSLGINGQFNYTANYKKDGRSWDNQIDFLYGYVNNSGQGYRKTLDRLFLDTKYGHQVSDYWDIFASLNLLSQFARGYRYEKDANGIEQSILISDIMAPAYITFALGAEYHPTDYFKVRISPFAPRVTLVNDPARFIPAVDTVAPYGVEPPDESRFEWLAFQVLAEFDKSIATNLNLKWRYLMFANYETLQLKTIDHRLELMMNAKVNRFITVGLGGILLYDFDQDSGAQVSQVFNLGFAYSFQNYEEKK